MTVIIHHCDSHDARQMIVIQMICDSLHLGDYMQYITVSTILTHK